MAETLDESNVEVVLSRPAYRLGGTVVGTVRLVAPQPRQVIKSAHVYVTGRCRIDSRWHNADRYRALYGSHPLLDESVDPRVEDRIAKEEQRDGATVCFWATNVVNLMELREREIGQWHKVKPQPLLTKEEPKSGSNVNDAEHETDAVTPLEEQQLSFTFRVDLPLDIYPTTAVTCCRYLYSVVVYAETVNQKLLLVQTPFTVLSPLGGLKLDNQNASTGRVKLGTCIAMAHSVGLPCYVSATELIRPKEQIAVNRHVGLISSAQHVQTLRVADQKGTLCCVLTAMGASVTSPGGRILLQFDFPRKQSNKDQWLPCYQVAACLEGEELAVNEDGTRNRARSFLFGGEHELIDSACTDRVSLSLCLPLDCPYTMESDLVAVHVWCKVELTIDQVGGNGYSTLRLDLPCEVVPGATADEMDNEEQDAMNNVPLEELLRGERRKEETDSAAQFKTKDIMGDLKNLSTLMIDNAGLREEIMV